VRNFTSKAWGSARRGNTSKNVIPSLGKPDWGSSEYGEESGRVRFEGIKKVGRLRGELLTGVDTEFGLEVGDI